MFLWGMGSFGSFEEIAEAALRRREAHHARLSAQQDCSGAEPMGSALPEPELASSSFWGLAACRARLHTVRHAVFSVGPARASPSVLQLPPTRAQWRLK